MADRHDYVALEWVKGEIAETLKQAVLALDSLIETPQATHAIDDCLTAIHQVHGSLQMVEFYGAALLAEEMELLALALQQDRVSHRDEAIGLLQQALGQLPIYLDRIHSARRDLPLVLLPLLNDLRSARGERLLSETSLFSPPLIELPALDGSALAQLEPPELAGTLRTWRQMLQVALAGLLRDQEAGAHLGYLSHVFAGLEALCRHAPLGPLWQVAAALVEGLREGCIANSPALRSLFKDTDQELKRLLEQGMSGVNQAAPPELLKSLLFYIAKADRPTARMQVLKARYGLDEALPDSALVDAERARLAGPDRDAMRSVLAALCEELVRVKERLDLFVRSDRQHTSDLDSLLAPLRQIADTLAVLGFGQPRKVIIDQLAVVQGLAQGQREPNDAILMDVAGALLYVESTLAGMMGTVEPESREESRLPTTDLSQIHQLVIKEVRICLQQVKDMIVDYIEADWDAQHLQALPALLVQVRGALSMIPLSRAASLIEACNGFISEHLLLDQVPPGWQQLDTLADAISAIEYYLERMSEDHAAPDEQVLDVAEQSLAALGYFPRTLPVAVPDETLKTPDGALPAPVGEAAVEVLSELFPGETAQVLDRQLLEIFRHEAETHLSSLKRFLDQAAERLPLQATDALQRALHTLKGSASMAGVVPMVELVSPFDQLAREYRAHLLALDVDEVELLYEAEGLLRRGLQQLAGNPLAEIAGARALIGRTQGLLRERLDALLNTPNTGLRLKRDPQLIRNFLAQGMDILLDAESLLQRWQQHPGEHQVLGALLDELTTLGEGAHLADVHPVDELCEALLDLYGAVEESSLAVSEGFFHEAQQAHEALIDMLDELAAGQEVSPQPARVRALRALLDASLDPSAMGLVKRDGQRVSSITELGAATAELGQAPRNLDEDIVSIFLEEAMDILEGAGQALHRWLAQPDNGAPLASLPRDLHTLKGGARMAEAGPVAELAHALEKLYEGLVERRYSHSDELVLLLQQGHGHLSLLLDQLQQRQPLADPGPLIEAIRGFHRAPAPGLEVAEAVGSETVAGHDPELLEIFLEEGFDIIDNAGAALLRWQAEPQSRQELETLLRDLHTLKGGARMVEIVPIGDLAHELEFLYEGLSAGVLQPSPGLFSLLQNSHDRLAQMLDATRAGHPVAPAEALIEAISAFSHPPVDPVPEVPDSESKPQVPCKPEALAAQSEAADMVKVSADLLDDLVNLAGETSILRGRIEQQANDAQMTLSEMETTLERMRDQLRRLDTETQGRILSRQQAEAERLGYEEFDPLEMDRHSQLQQLSRALFESASDLLDLKETLDRRNHEAQSLLQQQGRINTELQEGLMRSRMVPFERMLPRLQRIVRQVSSELGKDVDFVVGNAEGELDRNVLERMVAPLEHMLRNAVDHGLESASARLAAGKPAQGRITLDLAREGGDIIFDIRDDGAGVPLEAVRRKAIKRGLLDPNSDISAREVLQFIMQPGFSTAEKITQISGRGIGMDVVHEEVRQLGGSMSIDSTPGQGVHFRIRLPFTVAVNRALMVQCLEDQYAIPLNTIEGIVRVLPNELDAYYQLAPAWYEYAGQRYELRYLGELLKTAGRPRLLGQHQPLPILLVHCNERRVAVQVDATLGTREIVVKSLGQQFATVPGLSGATLLGDGRVVLILDLLALIRATPAHLPPRRAGHDAEVPTEVEARRAMLVLVVDDSVTVRKVTSRLLERHGMNVLTAKDGVDAMLLLEEHRPDLILLDIEMPRMDGFEVARQVRADPRLQHVPIIMITSRTGHKHRDRAMAIGVNDYLGKPYQESVLLSSIALWSKHHA